MKKFFVLTLVFVFALTSAAFADNMVKPDIFKQWLESGKKMIIVDIQPAADFEKGHFKGSIETNAYPVKTDADRKKLEGSLSKVKASKEDVVIICPRGGGGAKNTYEYFKSNGVPESRLYILEGGAEKWPHKEMYQKGR
jgi:rhodanese-related sulfurtransferase